MEPLPVRPGASRHRGAGAGSREATSLPIQPGVILVGRTTTLLWWPLLLVVVGLTGCGGSSTPGQSKDYPLVEPAPPERQAPVSTPNGSVVTLPALPTVYKADPSPTCERELATFHDGSQPTRRPIVIPPRPGCARSPSPSTRPVWSGRFAVFPPIADRWQFSSRCATGRIPVRRPRTSRCR
jgi:hypothetical protein